MEEIYFSRKVDDTGRICIPKELLNLLNINNNDFLKLLIFDDGILIKKESITIDYENFIRSVLTMKGNKYKDYLITKKEISEFEQLVDQFTNNLIKQRDYNID